MTVRIIVGDSLRELAKMPAESVHMVVTSPPYFGLRSYGTPPQVFGGDPACEHDWQDASWRADRYGAHDDDRLSDKQSTNGGSLGHRGGVHKQDTCRCGAWRGDLGLEPTMALYLDHMVEIFREVRRVLRADGTFWLNIGDSYGGSWGAQSRKETPATVSRNQIINHPKKASNTGSIRDAGLKPKDLMMIPARLAIRLQDDGWYLRSEIIWAKKSPMPESVTDRPTSAHEKVFLFAKSQRYFYDAEAVKEAALPASTARMAQGYLGNDPERDRHSHHGDGYQRGAGYGLATANQRNFWLLGPEPFPEAHFATFVSEIPRRAILAGTSEKGVCQACGAPWVRQTAKTFVPQPDVSEARGVRCADGQKPMDASSSWPGFPRGTTSAATTGWSPSCRCPAAPPVPATVLDCFSGAGTSLVVADRLGRDAIGIELNPAYAAMAKRRIERDAGLFAQVAAD